MTREGKRPLAALIAAVLAAALLAACGSSDSSSSSSTSTGNPSADSTTGATAQNARPSGAAPKDEGQKGAQGQQGQPGGRTPSHGGGGNGGSSGGNSGSSKSAKEIETPLKVSGGGSEQFHTKGGDNSIQEFGDESDESELQEAAEVVHDFYVARAQEEWNRACSYLAKSNIEQLEQLGSQSPRFKNAGCAPILQAFTQPVPASVNREITTVDAGSLRHEGEQGFLIYYGAGHATYAMPLRNEDGTWKVAALSGTTLG